MFSFLYILKSFCLFWFILQIYGKFSNLQIYFFSSVYEVWTHLTILMRDGSFPLSHAICRSTRIRTGVNFSSPLCKSGMFYHYTMDLLRSAWLESNQHFHLPITRSNLIRIEGYTPFRGQGGSRTHDGTFVHQINSLDFSATKATHPFL